MNRTRSRGIKLYPFLYLLFTCIYLYSTNDMATSTNAYQEQGDRTMVYFFLVLILTIEGVYLIRAWYKYIYLFTPCAAVILMTIWMTIDNLILGNMFNGSVWTCFTHIGLSLWWLLTLVFGYDYPRRNPRAYSQIILFMLFMFGYYCVQFIQVAIESNETHDTTTILNLIYRVLVFVPLLYLLENKKLRNILIALVFVLTFISMKRGAIIVLPIMLAVVSIVENRQQGKSMKGTFRIIGLIIVLVVLFYITDNVTGGFLSNRFSIEELKYGSSRSEKYTAAISEMSKWGVRKLITGVGSVKKSGIHNEWLEFMYTFGIPGLVIYFAFIISILKKFINLCRMKSKYTSAYSTAVVFIIIVGIYSGIYATHSLFYIMLFFGIVEGKLREEERRKWERQTKLSG